MIDFPLKTTIRGVDAVTEVVQRINRRINSILAPARNLGSAFGRFGNESGLVKFGARLGDVGGRIGGFSRRLLGGAAAVTGLAGALSVAGLVRFARDTADYADEMLKAAKVTGIGSTALQGLAFAADQSNVSRESLVKGLEKLNKNLVQARTKGGDLGKIFAAIGIGAEELKTLKPEQTFLAVAKGLSGIKDPALKAAAAQKLFGEAGLDLIPLLDQGEEGIRAFQRRAEELGIVLSEDALQGAADFGDSVSALKQTLTGLGRTITSKLLPQLTPLVERFTAFIAANRDLISAKAGLAFERIGAAIAGIDFGEVLESLKRFAGIVEKGIELVGGFGNASLIAAGILNLDVVASLFGIGRALVSLGALFLANPILAIIAAIAGAVFLIYQNWDGIVAWFQEKLDSVTSAFDEGFLAGILQLIAEFNPAVLFVEAINGLVKALFGFDMLKIAEEWLEPFWRGLRGVWADIQNLFIDQVNGLISLYNSIPFLDDIEEIERVTAEINEKAEQGRQTAAGLVPPGTLAEQAKTAVDVRIRVDGKAEVISARTSDRGPAESNLDVGASSLGFVPA